MLTPNAMGSANVTEVEEIGRRARAPAVPSQKQSVPETVLVRRARRWGLLAMVVSSVLTIAIFAGAWLALR